MLGIDGRSGGEGRSERADFSGSRVVLFLKICVTVSHKFL